MKRPEKEDKAFLDAWRELESILQDEGPCRVMDLEENLVQQNRSLDASKLRTCRQIRNFLIHDGPGFVSATGAMTAFVESMIYEILRVNGTVKDLMVSAAKYGACCDSEDICRAGSIIAAKKNGDLLVLDSGKNLMGIFGPRAMAMALAGGYGADRLAGLIAMGALDRAVTIPADMPAKQAPEHKCAVVDAKGRCVGVLHPERSWS